MPPPAMSFDQKLLEKIAQVEKGGAEKYHAKNRETGKLFARERIRLLVDEGSFVEDARLANNMDAELPSDGDYHSLGGFITAQLGRVPEIGAQLAAYGLHFEVRDADERRVSTVEITRLAPPESIVPRSASRITAA